jgi:hypothetical protein
MLSISAPEIIRTGIYTEIRANITYTRENNAVKTLWFRVPNEYAEYLVHERGDAFVVAMLLYAMETQQYIHSSAPLSENLHHNLCKLIAAYSHAIPDYNHIFIMTATGDHLCDPLPNAGAVGTALSCGVDSFYTVLTNRGQLHHYDHPPEPVISHLTFWNLGANRRHGDTPKQERELYQARLQKVQAAAAELEKPVIPMDSNISEIDPWDYGQCYTLRIATGVLLLQKLFSTYYIASGYPVWDMRMGPGIDMGRYDSFTLPLLGTETTSIIPHGAEMSRQEKLAAICHDTTVQKYLNVCVDQAENCGTCYKCRRTLLGLDAIGGGADYSRMPDAFGDVFDVDAFYRNRTRHIGRLIVDAATDPFSLEILDAMLGATLLRSLPYAIWYTFRAPTLFFARKIATLLLFIWDIRVHMVNLASWLTGTLAILLAIATYWQYGFQLAQPVFSVFGYVEYYVPTDAPRNWICVLGLALLAISCWWLGRRPEDDP